LTSEIEDFDLLVKLVKLPKMNSSKVNQIEAENFATAGDRSSKFELVA